MNAPQIKLAGEGYLDLAVLRRLAADEGFVTIEEYGRRGKAFVDARLPSWNLAARHNPWFVLRDLDNDAPCAAALAARLLPESSNYMCFRIAVCEVESWLLADRAGCIEYLGFRSGDVPRSLDDVVDAKERLLRAADRATGRDVRRGLVGTLRSGQIVEGDSYNSILSQFIAESWNPKRAQSSSDSLFRARRRIAELAAKVIKR